MIKYVLIFILKNLILSAAGNFNGEYMITLGEEMNSYLIFYTTPIINMIRDLEQNLIVGKDMYVVVVVVNMVVFKDVITRYLQIPVIKNAFKIYLHKTKHESIDSNQLLQEINGSYQKKNLTQQDSFEYIEIKPKDFFTGKFNLSIMCDEIEFPNLSEACQWDKDLCDIHFEFELLFKNVISDDKHNIQLNKDTNVIMERWGHGKLNRVDASDVNKDMLNLFLERISYIEK